MPLLQLRTARDMLEKSQREYSRLSKDFKNIDNIFNFFVTVHHISDYLRNTNAVTNQILENFLQDQDIKDCRDICNTGKHLILTRHENLRTDIRSSMLGKARLGALILGSPDRWFLYLGDREINIEYLAKKVLTKWEDFFVARGI